jgi:hypothetical protein
MARKKPDQHFPTAAERDEKTQLDIDPETALKILLGASNDLDEQTPSKPDEAAGK